MAELEFRSKSVWIGNFTNMLGWRKEETSVWSAMTGVGFTEDRVMAGWEAGLDR